MINIEEVKKKIISFLETNGPSLPIKIAKSINMEMVFTSAILSELMSAQKITTSFMKVGSSNIFYLRGQEQKLEQFADQYIDGIVKKAYELIKKNKILVDEEQEPAIRVALRTLKDFTSSFNYKNKILWKYNFIQDQEVNSLLKQKFQEENIINKVKVDIFKEKGIEDKIPLKDEEKQISEKKQDFSGKKNQKFKKGINEKSKNSFSKEVKNYLEEKQIKLIQEIDETKNEYLAKIKINSNLGDILFMLIAKNKKIITENDILISYQKSSEKKMPCYLIHKGKLSKKALELAEQYTNLIKVDLFGSFSYQNAFKPSLD